MEFEQMEMEPEREVTPVTEQAAVVPAHAFFKEVHTLAADVEAVSRLMDELDGEMNQLDQEITALNDEHRQVQVERESFRVLQDAGKIRTLAVRQESERIAKKRQEAAATLERLDGDKTEMLRSQRDCRKAMTREMLRLTQHGLEISRHYVLDLDGSIEKLTKSNLLLAEQAHAMYNNQQSAAMDSSPAMVGTSTVE